MDIGRIGYEAIDRTILDITGLTDRFIAKSLGTFLAKMDDLRYGLERAPDVVVRRFYFRKSPDGPASGRTTWTKNAGSTTTRTSRASAGACGRRRPIARAERTVWRAWLGAERAYPFTFPPRYEVLAVFVRRSES